MNARRHASEKPSKDPLIAFHEASIALAKVRSRDQEVRRVAASLRQLRERNHFAERLRVIMREE